MAKEHVEAVFGPQWVQDSLEWHRRFVKHAEEHVLNLRYALRKYDSSLPDIHDGHGWYEWENSNPSSSSAGQPPVGGVPVKGGESPSPGHDSPPSTPASEPSIVIGGSSMQGWLECDANCTGSCPKCAGANQDTRDS